MGALHHIMIQYALYSFFSIVSTIKFNRILQISLYLFSLFFLGLNFVVKITKNRQIQYILYYLLQFPKTVNSVFNHCFFSTPPPCIFSLFLYILNIFSLYTNHLSASVAHCSLLCSLYILCFICRQRIKSSIYAFLSRKSLFLATFPPLFSPCCSDVFEIQSGVYTHKNTPAKFAGVFFPYEGEGGSAFKFVQNEQSLFSFITQSKKRGCPTGHPLFYKTYSVTKGSRAI